MAGLLIQKEDRHRGNQVRISYSIEDRCFKIMDLGVGLGTYSRIEHHGHPLVLKSN